MERKWHLFWIFAGKYVRHRGGTANTEAFIIFLTSLFSFIIYLDRFFQPIHQGSSHYHALFPFICYYCMDIHRSHHQYQYNICTLFSCVAAFLWQLNSEDRDTVILQTAEKYLCSDTVLYSRFKYSYKNTADSCARMWCSVFVWCVMSVI